MVIHADEELCKSSSPQESDFLVGRHACPSVPDGCSLWAPSSGFLEGRDPEDFLSPGFGLSEEI